MFKGKISDTVLLSGWLFADLLLGLMVIFMVALPPARAPVPIPPTLVVTPTSLDLQNPACTGGTSAPQCVVTIKETGVSSGSVTWTVTNDMSDHVAFQPSTGNLSPGGETNVTISALPCQNGSITFNGSRNAKPVIIPWHCTPPPVMPDRLDFNYRSFTLTVNDIPGLLAGNAPAVNNIKNQVRAQGILQGRRVGLAVVYGGAPDDGGIVQAQQVSNAVYRILGTLGGPFASASYYVPLYTLGNPASLVNVDVYMFQLPS